MEADKGLKLLAAMFLNRIITLDTSKKIEITPLWLMSFVKLESMCPSFKEFTDFFHQFFPMFLSVSRIAMFILLKQREYEQNLQSSFKHESPPLSSDFDVPKISRFNSSEVKPDDSKSNSESIDSYFFLFDESIRCSPDVKNYFYEKFSKSFVYSKREFVMLLDELGDFLSIARNLVSDILSFHKDDAIKAGIQKDYATEESKDSNPSLREEGNKPKSEIIVSVESGNCELSRRVDSMRFSSNLELQKDDLSDALYRPLKETSKLDNIFLLNSLFDEESNDDASTACKSSNSVVSDEDNFSEETDFALKEEIDPLKSTTTTSNFCSSRKMPSKCILYSSEAHKAQYSEEVDSLLKEEIESHLSTITDSSIDMSSECFSSLSDGNKDHYSKKQDSHLKGETDKQGILITASDFCVSAKLSSECILPLSDVQYSKEPDSPLKEKTNPQKSALTSNFYSSTEILNKCILSNFGRQFLISGETFKIINLIEFAYHLRGNDYSKRMNTSFENSEEVCFYFSDQADFENAKLLQNQFLCAKKNATINNLVHVEEFSESKDTDIQKNYENYYQTSIFDEAKKLLKCEFLEYLQEMVEEICPTKEETYSQLEEEFEFQEHAQDIRVKVDKEVDYSSAKMNCSSEKTRKYKDLDNDLVQKILFSVYDFICEVEENAFSRMKKQNLISERLIESEGIHFEPDCVKSIRILLYFLNNITMDLESKKDEVSKLKFGLEDVRELYSCDIKNTKEGRELQEIAKKFVADYDKVYAGIEKDLAHCEWYQKNLKNILDFYQNKCFIGSPGL